MGEEEYYKALTERLERIESMLSAATVKDVLTMDECAAYMGCSKNYLYQLTAKSEIPYYKPRGKYIYFRRVEIDGWLLGNRHSSNGEIERMASAFCAKRGKTKKTDNMTQRFN